MSPDTIPDELIETASQAWLAAPQNRDGQPTRLRHALAAAWPQIEQAVRAQVAADLQRAAAGRRDYATRAPEHLAVQLCADAANFDTAAKVATDPRQVMWGLIPADWRTDDDRPDQGEST